MSVIRPISTVFRNDSSVCLIHIYSHCKQLHFWNECDDGIFFGGGGAGEDSNKKVVL